MAEDKRASETESAEEIQEEKEIEVPAKFKSLVEQIEQMSVLELSELVKVFEEKFGVSAAAPMMAAPAAGGEAGAAEGAEEKTSFTVELKSAGEQKINVIRAIREVTELTLKDAKDLVDNAPRPVKENVGKEEAETIKQKIEEAGGAVEIK